LYGYFSNTLDTIYSTFSSKQTPEPEPQPVEQTITLEPIDNNTPALMNTTLGNVANTVANIPKSAITNPVEIKPIETQNVVNDTVPPQPSETKSLFGVVSPTVVQEPAVQSVSVVQPPDTAIQLNANANQITTTDQPVTEQPVTEKPVTETPVTEQPVTEPQVATQIADVSQPVTDVSQPVTDVIPVPPTSFWNIRILKIQNALNELNTLEQNEKQLRQVLWFNEMETKSQIYVNGKFYNVLNTYIKLGTVEPADPAKNSVADYLKTVPIIENTLFEKYYNLYVKS
jgi:hypothetical protein